MLCSRSRGAWGRFAWLLALALAALPAGPVAGQARAQDAEKKADAAPPEADKAAPPAADPTPATASAPAPPAATVQTKSMLRWAVEASGPIGLFIVGLSLYFFSLVFKLFMEFRLKEAVPPALVEKLDTAVKEKKFQEVYDACRENESFLARLVRTGVANLPNGKAESKEAMGAMAEEIVTGMEARISYLATIGTLGPMIGLVGTIWGMILSFRELATTTGAQPRPEKLAEGISTALFITLEGVSLSVPAIFFFAFFRNRIAMMAVEAGRTADRIIASMLAMAKQAKTV